MSTLYKTNQGDTFDIISKKFYGDEKYIFDLISANSDYRDVIFFDANVSITVPDLDENTNSDTTAPWRG